MKGFQEGMSRNERSPVSSLVSQAFPGHRTASHGLTSLPSASSLLLTCLLTCTDQLYQQLEQNRRLTNQLKLALNED
ncbi:hypothetical protein Celaphus_00006251 [Cervus elaphus hippelaphus]|uniref:Uncharacterized protein n=1 Tax=Cervus elaphus hippelaphus TaxID=46360 RepID=A0A212CTW0_CEREH|nr:hypothetical protein Celaphus_00006251 [Cervus elaphus hippelaphus]